MNLLNQKDARVYIQTPAAEYNAAPGSRVDIRLTLDTKKVAESRAAAEKRAREIAEERMRLEEERADSLAQAALERGFVLPPEAKTPTESNETEPETDAFFY